MDGQIPLSSSGRRAESLAVNPTSNEYAFDDYDVQRFVPVAASFGQSRYGFVVTPNVDHLVRLQREPRFAYAYNVASYVLLDSRLLSSLLRWVRQIDIPTCPGSDLTEELLRTGVHPDDRIVLIGGTLTQARKLASKYRLRRLVHHAPPMDFIKSPAAIEQCLRFIEDHSPFRYCLLAVGSPQQEYLAQALRSRGLARGLALCVGASVDFLTGAEKRAPQWLRRLSLEWLYRALQNPRRLAARYFKALPGLLQLLRNARFGVRAPASAASLQLVRSFSAVFGSATAPSAESAAPLHRSDSALQPSPVRTA